MVFHRAILALAGDVAGRRVLDAGCGSSPLSAALRDRGAIVTGIDSSAGMLQLARRRLGDDARLQQADLKSALPFPDDGFDDVMASLVLHYLEDWTAPLAELRRVLTPGGRLIMSVNHPSSIYIPRLYPPGRRADYFATHSWTVPWTLALEVTGRWLGVRATAAKVAGSRRSHRRARWGSCRAVGRGQRGRRLGWLPSGRSS
jgi:SAM-dependent methyltransferase